MSISAEDLEGIRQALWEAPAEDRRFRAAKAAMQALIAKFPHHAGEAIERHEAENIARRAVIQADALLAELAKPPASAVDPEEPLKI